MIEIMDTTLRDGEQTSGVSFAAHEKLSIAQVLLNDLGVNRVEIASARVSDGEFEAVKRVAAWAARSGNLDKLEVLGFVDGTVSLDWIESAGCRVVNLLCKGSYKHVTEQLRKTPEQHVDDIRTVVLEAAKRKIDVNIYLEDWSNGIKHSPDYVFLVIDALKGLPICRFMLPEKRAIRKSCPCKYRGAIRNIWIIWKAVLLCWKTKLPSPASFWRITTGISEIV